MISGTITKGTMGTPGYMAPEIISDDDDAQYSEKSDVFSFGVLLCAVWGKKMGIKELYPSLSKYELAGAVKNGTKPSLPEDCPKELQQLIRG
jgi:serine/threonine protein kinase